MNWRIFFKIQPSQAGVVDSLARFQSPGFANFPPLIDIHNFRCYSLARQSRGSQADAHRDPFFISPIHIPGGVVAVLSGIQACVFDAYGTLFDFNSAVARHRARLGDIADQFSALWRKKQLEYTWLRSLMHRHADFYQVTLDALDYCLVAFDVMDSALRLDLMDAYRQLDCYPDVRPTLEQLKADGFLTAILSNGSPSMLQTAVKSANIQKLVDRILSVEQIGVYKPDPRVYQLAVDQLALSPRKIAFQSSNAWDTVGAANFGLRVVWVNRFNQSPEKLPFKADAEIKSLSELAALLSK
ncbi:MAG: haloacid dehalogenase type II [Chloroflexi bacterium]|nr:haloacid dehalogenase type II [Chloroflexota bacterium]